MVLNFICALVWQMVYGIPNEVRGIHNRVTRRQINIESKLPLASYGESSNIQSVNGIDRDNWDILSIVILR